MGEVIHKGPQTVRFYRLPGTGGLVTKEYRISFLGNENILKLIVVANMKLQIYIKKTHSNAHLK